MFCRYIFSILLEHVFSKFVCRMFNQCVRCLFTPSLRNISVAIRLPTIVRVVITISVAKSNALRNNVLQITMRPITFRTSLTKGRFTRFNMSYIYDSYFDLSIERAVHRKCQLCRNKYANIFITKSYECQVFLYLYYFFNVRLSFFVCVCILYSLPVSAALFEPLPLTMLRSDQKFLIRGLY